MQLSPSLVFEVKCFLPLIMRVGILFATDIEEIEKKKLEDRRESFKKFVFAKNLNSRLTEIGTVEV